MVITNSRKVSRKHCCICQVNETFVIRDLGSLNGVRVNGKRVKKESRIHFGDEVSIGDVPFRLQKAKAAAPSRQPAAGPGEDGLLRSSAADRPASRAASRKPDRPIAMPPPPADRVQPGVSRRPSPTTEKALPSTAAIRRKMNRSGTMGPPNGDDEDDDEDIPEAVILDDNSTSGSEIDARNR